MSQDKTNATENTVVSQLWGKISESVRAQAIEQKARFLAATKPTQYAIAASVVFLVGLLFSFDGNSNDTLAGSITFRS